MKALMLPLIAFVLFFALGSGAGVYTSAKVAPDSTHADSTHADPTKPDSAHADSSHADSTKSDSTTGDSTPAAATIVPHTTDHEGAATPTTAPGTTPATRPAGTRGPNSVEALVRAQTGATVTMRRDGSIGPEKPDSTPDYARMASLLAKMGAREAARTVEQLSSKDAAHALAAMSDRQAALVLAQLSPEKSASLLQASLALIPRTVAP